MSYFVNLGGALIGETQEIIEQLELRVRRLERELKECHEKLTEEENNKEMYQRWYREERDKLKESEEARKSNERILTQLQANVEQDKKRHADEMAIARKKTEETIEALEVRHMKTLEKVNKDHKKEMSTSSKAHADELAKLEGDLKKTKQEGMERLIELEGQNEALKQEQVEAQLENQVKIEKLMEEHQKKNEKAKKVKRALKNEVANEKQKLLQLEQKHQEEAAEKLDEELKRRIEFSATQNAMKKFLKITKTVKDVGESLNYIKAHCSTNSIETMDDNVDMYVNEILSSKSMLKEEVYRFEQLLINEQSVQQEVLKACKDYVHKYENLMDQDKFFNLCANLPSAIQNKDLAEIEEFGKLAGNLSSELKDDREEIEKKLEQISSGNMQKSLE